MNFWTEQKELVIQRKKYEREERKREELAQKNWMRITNAY